MTITLIIYFLLSWGVITQGDIDKGDLDQSQLEMLYHKESDSREGGVQLIEQP